MRLSTLKTDPGYKPSAELRKYEVFLNGVKETLCETADEEQGYIVRVMKVYDRYQRKAILRRSGKIFGKVEIQEII